MAIEELNATNFTEKVSSATVPVLIDFYADWCGPCKMLAPVLQQISDENQGQLIVYKVNTDSNPDLAMQHDIKSIPCVISYVNGSIHNRVVGAVPKQTILDLIK